MANIDPTKEAGTDTTARKTIPMTPKGDQPGWGIPILFAAVAFVAGILIFSAAGPEHMRTANVDQNTMPAQSAPSVQPAPAQPQNSDTPAMSKQ